VACVVRHHGRQLWLDIITAVMKYTSNVNRQYFNTRTSRAINSAKR